MTQPAAGWYPDPGGSGGQRWWNGQSWSDSVQPAPAAPTAPMYGGPTPGYTPYPPSPQVGRRTASGNRSALITFAIVAVYLVLAAETRIVFFGILPLGYALRSRRMREPLWPLAMGAAILSIVIAAALIFGR